MKSIAEEKARIVILCVIAWGFILRIIGYNWGGEGMIFNTDEFSVVEPIIHMVENHTLLHQVWVYPAMSSSKLIAIMLMPISFINHISRFDYYYIVRIAYALFSTFIIWLSYILVKKVEGNGIAILFAFLLSINPTMVKYSKMAVGDTPVLMFWLLVALFMNEYISDRRISKLILMSFFAACAMLEKWNGAGITVFIAIGVIFYNIRNIKKLVLHGIVALIAWVVSMLILAPNIITSVFEIESAVVEANQALGSNPIFGQFKFFLDYSGIGALTLMVIGFITILLEKYYRNDSEKIYSSRFLYIIVIVSLLEDWALCQEQVERHGMVVQWGCLLFICLGFCSLLCSTKSIRVVGIMIFSLVILSFLLSVVLADVVAIRSRQHDTRVVGKEFLESIGADIHNTIGESYTPFYPPIGDNVMDGAYEYGNMIKELVFYDEDGIPCVALPNKKYAIIGDYKWADKNAGGYAILNAESKKTFDFISDYKIDLKADFKGLGLWYGSELDTIRENVIAIKRVLNSNTIGPSFKVYDISSFAYKER